MALSHCALKGMICHIPTDLFSRFSACLIWISVSSRSISLLIAISLEN